MLGFCLQLHEFGKIYHQTLELDFVNKPTHFGLECHVQNTLQTLSFEENEANSIAHNTIELIRLQKKCIHVESWSATSMTYATAFFAWKAEQIEKRYKVSLKHFCSQFRIATNLRRHVAIVQKFLNDSVVLLPWTRKHCLPSKRMVIYYIKDILENPQTIACDYLKKVAKKCSQKQFKCLPLEEMDVDGDQDISDSEIDCYIRSESEVKLISKLQQKLEKDD